ncbi:hypothetical protein V8H57_002008 [Salmonella enterica]
MGKLAVLAVVIAAALCGYAVGRKSMSAPMSDVCITLGSKWMGFNNLQETVGDDDSWHDSAAGGVVKTEIKQAAHDMHAAWQRQCR